MLSPSHARLWEVLDFTIGFEVLEEWKRKMVQINEEVAAEYNNPPFVFWDFTGYHELTTEAVPAPDSASQEMEWHYETSHYKPALSDVVFDRIYGLDTPYEDFGRVIHSGNIDEHLSTLRDERREWTEAYREALQEMRSYLRESTQNAL
jgi:hypothetical protein